MAFPSSALVFFFTAFLGLWPVAFLVALLLHAFNKRWRRVGQIALLLPLWTIAASVGLMQLAPFIAALDAPSPSRSPFVAVMAIGFVLCCAAVAWALLIRSFGGQTPSDAAQGLTPPPVKP